MTRFALVSGGLLALAAAAALAGGGACGTRSGAAPEGGECFLATDCANGLVCLPQEDGRRLCTSDVTGIQKVPEPGDTPDAAADGALDGPLDPDARVTMDSSTDARTPPPDAPPPDATPPPDVLVPDVLQPPPDADLDAPAD